MEKMSQEHTRSSAAITTERPSLPCQESQLIQRGFIQYSCAALMDLRCKRFLVSPVVCVVLNINRAALGDAGVCPGTGFPSCGALA